MHRKHQWTGLMAGGALLALAPLAQAADVAADYSTVSNPAAPWSYGQFIAGPGSFQLHPNSFFGGDTGAVHFWDQGFPASSFVSKETGGANATSGSTVWNAGDVVLRPGINNQAAVVRFTASAAGTYAYTCTFGPADPGGGTRGVGVVVKNVLAASAPLNGPIGVAVPVTLSNAAGVFLNVGETIEFMVNSGGSPQDFDVDAAVLRNARVDQLAVSPANLPCRWKQPWTKPLASHISVVQDCLGNEVSWAPAALDDFRCDEDTKFSRLTWWGTNPTQNGVPQRLFFIRIWLDNQQCFAEEPVYQLCVVPKIRLVGVDCTGRRVFRFAAHLNPAFLAIAGQHYWIQISEVDDDPNNPFDIFPSSPSPGQPDFAWSGHRPVKLCNATQRNFAAGIFQSPLFDPCDGDVVDLAFSLSSRFFSGTITPIPTGPSGGGIYTLQLRDPTTGDLLEEKCIRTDENGEFECESDLPNGTSAEMHIHGMATVGGFLAKPVDFRVDSFFDVFFELQIGDADNDGGVRFRDVTTVLGNWLAEFGPLP